MLKFCRMNHLFISVVIGFFPNIVFADFKFNTTLPEQSEFRLNPSVSAYEYFGNESETQYESDQSKSSTQKNVPPKQKVFFPILRVGADSQIGTNVSLQMHFDSNTTDGVLLRGPSFRIAGGNYGSAYDVGYYWGRFYEGHINPKSNWGTTISMTFVDKSVYSENHEIDPLNVEKYFGSRVRVSNACFSGNVAYLIPSNQLSVSEISMGKMSIGVSITPSFYCILSSLFFYDAAKREIKDIESAI